MNRISSKVYLGLGNCKKIFCIDLPGSVVHVTGKKSSHNPVGVPVVNLPEPDRISASVTMFPNVVLVNDFFRKI